MDLTKKTVHYTQEGKTVFDRFYLDEDYNVPEQKEAVQRIVYSSAKLKTEDVRPVENVWIIPTLEKKGFSRILSVTRVLLKPLGEFSRCFIITHPSGTYTSMMRTCSG